MEIMKEQSYKDYSITELREALFNIDAQEYPDRLKEINSWLKIRLEQNPDFDKNSVYIGFWPRFIASVIDGLFISIVVFLSVRFFETISENSELFGSLLNFTYVLIFWLWFSATLGKMALGIVIVDEKQDYHRNLINSY